MPHDLDRTAPDLVARALDMPTEPHRHNPASRTRALALALVWVLAGVSVHAEEPVPLVPIQRFVLDNGMTFLLVDRPESPTISVGWVAAVGSADDPEGRTGLSHMLEHMMFKGSRTLKTSELDVLYATAGATGLNAVTRLDATAYFVTLPPEKLEIWFWLESDRLLQPVFRDFEVEKQVVLEERRLRVEAMPTGRLEEELRARLWGEDPYGRPGIGRPEDIDRLGPEDATQHFEAHYGAGNLTAVLVGPVDPARILALARRYFERLSRGPERPEAHLPGPLSEIAALEATCDCRPQTRALYRAVSLSHPDGPALEVLVGLLNGRTGRLHRSLVLDQEIAFSAYSQYTPLERGGVLSLIAEAKGGTEPAELLAALDLEIARLLDQPPGPREIQKVRNQLRANAFRRLKAPSQLMLELLLQAGMGEVGYLDRWLAAVETIDAAALQDAARRYLDPQRRVVGLFDRSAPPSEGGAAVGKRP